MYGCSSSIIASNGLPLLCTLGAGHTGSHIAGMTGCAEPAAVWLEPAGYPRKSGADLVWACCESAIGPVCVHVSGGVR